MYDASLSGAGVVTRGDLAAQLPEIGRVRERSRYRQTLSVAPRAAALAASTGDVFSDPETVLPTAYVIELDPYERNPQFAEVPSSILEFLAWDAAFSYPFTNPEPITILESRAAVAAARHLLRAQRSRGHRLVIFGDNLGAQLAFERCRASSYPLLTSVRRM